MSAAFYITISERQSVKRCFRPPRQQWRHSVHSGRRHRGFCFRPPRQQWRHNVRSGRRLTARRTNYSSTWVRGGGRSRRCRAGWGSAREWCRKESRLDLLARACVRQKPKYSTLTTVDLQYNCWWRANTAWICTYYIAAESGLRFYPFCKQVSMCILKHYITKHWNIRVD